MKRLLTAAVAVAGLALVAVAEDHVTIPTPQGGWKSKAVCISVPEPGDVSRFCGFIRDELAPAGIDTLVLMVRYSYQFKSHPEVAEPDAISFADVQAIRAACKSANINLVPKMNLLGHQGENRREDMKSGLLFAHPELDESLTKETVIRDYHRSICPRHPNAFKIVTELADELCDAFGANMMHIGCDEVFEIGMCERCKGIPTDQLFADWVNSIARHLKARGVKTMIWGDRLLSARNFAHWEASDNGTDKALGKVDKDVIICDWHYHCWKAFPSVESFGKAGYKMYVCPWRSTENMVSFMDYAVKHDMGQYAGVMLTTWCGAAEFMDAVEGKTPSNIDPESAEEYTLKPMGRNFHLLFPRAKTLNATHPVEIIDFGPSAIGGYPAFSAKVLASARSGEAPRLRVSYSTHPDGLGPKGDFWRETSARYLGPTVDLPILPANINRYDVFAVTNSGDYRAELLQGEVRYARLELENAADGARLEIGGFTLVNDKVHSEGERDGFFRCSDSRLTRLWLSSVRTCELSAIPSYEARHVTPAVTTLPYLADGAKRDRLVWSGDLWWAQRNVYFGFGTAEPYMKGSIELLAANQTPEGYVQACPWPEQPKPGVGEYGPFGSDEFAAWFVPVLRDHLLYRGDGELAKRMWPTVKSLVAYLNSHRRADGIFEQRKETSKHAAGLAFGEASLHHRAYMNLLLWKTLVDAADIAEGLGCADEATEWRGDAERFAAVIRREFWDAEKGWFRTSIEANEYAKEANALALAVRFVTSEEAGRLMPLLQWHHHGKFQLLAARGRFEYGDGAGAMAMLKAHNWFKLIDPEWKGVSTTSECCDLIRKGWGDECHPDTAVAGVISNYILGIRPLKDGFSSFAFAPQTVGLNFAEGEVPTPFGKIKAKWTLKDGQLEVELTVPKGTTAEFAFGGEKRTLAEGKHEFSVAAK